jgi:dTDP-4-dehydrorhamnose reductase
MQPVMVLGAGGQLGAEWMRALALTGFLPLGISRSDLDAGLADRGRIARQLASLLDRWQPVLLVNALAYTAVDRAESEPALARQVNGWFPALLGREAKGVPVVHFSTDYVFDGSKSEPYLEDDEPCPLSQYGASKLEGERGLLDVSANALVVRTSWVVGASGQNFARTILRLACERNELRVVADQIGVPTPTRFLVQQILGQFPPPVAERSPAGPSEVIVSPVAPTVGAAAPRLPTGLFHLVPSGQTSWHAYAQRVLAVAHQAEHWRLRLRVLPEAVVPLRTSDYPTKAQRPTNSLLDTLRWRTKTGQSSLIDWEDALAPVLAEMLEGESNARDKAYSLSSAQSVGSGTAMHGV